MKIKALLLALFTAGLAVSMALAAAPAAVGETSTTTTAATTTSKAKGKGKHKVRSEARIAACKSHRKIELKGEFVAPGAGGFAMTVTGGNRAARPWKGKQATVLVDEKSKFHGKKHSLGELAAGDRIHVQGYACKADVAAGTVLARKVKSKGPKREHDETTTTATTTAVTTTAP